MYEISNLEARKFLLRKHGLIGEHKFFKSEGVKDFIREVGCIQFDPLDICGRNADLVLQSRIKDYQKSFLYHELYEKRSLIDYWDKNMSIFLIDDWPYFSRIRDRFFEETRSKEEFEKIYHMVMDSLSNNEFASTKDLEFNDKVDWYWTKTSLSKVALETLYYRGEVLIHHKKGTIRYFSLANKLLPETILNSPDPNQDDLEYYKWRILRRIKGVGLLWNKPSDAFLFIRGLKAKERNLVFNSLLSENKIIEVRVEGIKSPFYIVKEDEEILKEVLSGKEFKERCELIAPLDNLLWDRKLIKAIFDFDYTWEVYTPLEKRKYAHYVLPVVIGSNFIARIEVIAEYKDDYLHVKNLWFEANVTKQKSYLNLIEKRLEKFKVFNELKNIRFDDDFIKKT